MKNIVQTVYHSEDLREKTPHFHDCHQIILVLKGQVDFFVNGASFPAGEGDLAIFSRYENHSVRVRSAEYERYILHIDPDVVNHKSAVYSLLTDRPNGFCNIINVAPNVEQIVGIFRMLVGEHSGAAALADEMEQLLVKQLLITIYRCTNLQFDDLHDTLVIDLKRQFENNCSLQYSLADLAKRHNVSVSALSHRFHGVTGTSVMKYLMSCRIARAKQLLIETDSSIGQIVEKCGFSDNSNFSRTFKALNGISPTDFRQKYKAE